MKIGDFYKYAVEYAQRMRFARPQLAECNAAFVTNENDEVFSCISGITIQDGDVVDVPADTSAYAMMKDAGFDIAKNIAVIRLYDDELLEPSVECMEIMLAINKNNKNCMVCLGPDKEITLSAARNIVEDQVVDLTKTPIPEIDDEEYEEKADEPEEQEAEAAEIEQAAEETAETEEQPAEEAAPMPDFMMGFDFSADEPAETTPEDEEKALEEKKARQKAAQEAIDKKLAEKAAAEAAKGVSTVKVEENNPFAATSDAVTPVEDTLAVFEDVASGKADSFKPKDEIDAKPLISPEELLKQAKRRKKVAKSNFFFRKRM
ncbi:MAG: hypothetical protein J6O40_07460 [Ruminococcus sp.]|nr:hypothetical protein [Ruminococcus sp.]